MSVIITTTPAVGGPAAGHQLAAVGCLLAVGSLLGLSLVVGKLAVVAGAAPLAFLSVALLASGTLLFVGEWLGGRIPKIDRRLLTYALVTGALFAAPNVIAFLAVRHVGAGFLSLTFAFPILLTYVLSLALRLEPLRAAKAAGVAAGLAGGSVLALSKVRFGDAPAFWILLAMGSPAIIAVGNIYRTLRWPKGVAPRFLAAAMLVTAGLMILPPALVLAPSGIVALFTEADQSWLLGFQTGVFSLLYVLYFVLQRMAGPVYLSQIGSVAAVVGTAIAVLLLNEAAPPNLAWATVFIGVAMILFHRRGDRARGNMS